MNWNILIGILLGGFGGFLIGVRDDYRDRKDQFASRYDTVEIVFLFFIILVLEIAGFFLGRQ